MKKILIFLCAMLLIFGIVGTASATLINGGFETGDFTGWTATVPPGGSASVATSHNTGFPYLPVEGDYFALLKTDGPGNYITLSQSIYLNLDDILSGWAAFDANDYLPFNDNAYVHIYNSYGNLVALPWYDDVAEVSDFGNSNWTSWAWTATASDTYTLTFGVANSGDSIEDSYALFDANVHQPVPEPATMLLLGSGLIGLAAFGRKKFFKKS